MPVLPTKQNVSPAFGTFLPARRATGEDFNTAGAAGRELAQAGEKITQAASALQVSFERDDVLTAQKGIADIRTAQTLRIQKMQEEGGPDGDISAITSTITQEADTALSAARSKLGTGRGKRVFDALSADLKAVLVPRAAAVQAHLVGLKAKAQFDDTLNALGTALISDPTQLQSALQSAEFAIANTPGLPAAARIQLAEAAKEALTKAAVQGQINLNPWAAKAALQAGKYDDLLKVEDKAPLISAAETKMRQLRYDAEAGAASAARAQKHKDMKFANDSLAKIVDGEMKGKDILDADISYAAKTQLLAQAEHYEKRRSLLTGVSDAGVSNDLFTRINLPPGAPDRIETQAELNQAVIDGHIKLPVRNALAQILNARDNPADQPHGPATLRFLSTVAPMFRFSMYGINVSFADDQAAFTHLVFQRVKEAAEKGQNVDELFDRQNPKSLFKMLEQHKPTMQEAIRRMADKVRAGSEGTKKMDAAATKPGVLPVNPGRAAQSPPAFPWRPPGPMHMIRPGDTNRQRGSDGKMHTFIFKGGDPTEPTNYEIAPDTVLPAPTKAEQPAAIPDNLKTLFPGDGHLMNQLREAGGSRLIKPGDVVELKGHDGKMHDYWFVGGHAQDPANYRIVTKRVPAPPAVPETPLPSAVTPGMLGR